MRRLNVTNHSLGFTLFEQLVVLVIIGVVTAIAAPSFLILNQKAKVDDAMNSLRIGIQEGQRQAITKSKDCTITLPATGTTNPTIRSDCFLYGNVELNDVTLAHNYAPDAVDPSISKIVFDYKGRPSTISDKGTMVVYIPGIEHQKCLVISNLIGMTRSGDYDDVQTNGVSSTSCTTSN